MFAWLVLLFTLMLYIPVSVINGFCKVVIDWLPAQVRHVKTGSSTANLAANNIRTEMCRRIMGAARA